ncbi:nuclear transport factor 2 family protein [Streptomyces sp. SL13]|jgi:ketosteroid isomerase-like protein|uniref:Nuclear transport factor 2 family protein n=1 Tax=Streptantibioticus silvisoli TaxID=2705255 RepID=A0AA90GV41_9ACTN|nr:nuclear transport factor 2 family protein [Streptantibioticus silvisoli]MDI5963305.1 nuclear transport factor 2 family protein [Streptantibioticus silvisoli]MDI5968514.1 nuclear transport factor 2 family protein [Streptantibioticus silvisoli]
MSELTVERVGEAFAALGSGDREKMLQYWDENVRFEIPGNHAYAGWYEGLDSFLGFLKTVGEMSGGSYLAENITVMVNAEDGWSVDVNRDYARRAGVPEGETSPYLLMDVEAMHLLRWRDGRVVEGRGTILGDGLTTSSLWWSPIAADGTRTA